MKNHAQHCTFGGATFFKELRLRERPNGDMLVRVGCERVCGCPHLGQKINENPWGMARGLRGGGGTKSFERSKKTQEKDHGKFKVTRKKCYQNVLVTSFSDKNKGKRGS